MGRNYQFQQWTNLSSRFGRGIFIGGQPQAQSVATDAKLFPYQRVGHLIVLNIGTSIFGLDPINKKVLWQKDLLTQEEMKNWGAQLYIDWEDGSLRIPTFNGQAFGQGRTFGRVGPATASCVCVVTRDGLEALDPEKGTVLWTRSNVATGSRMFGDSQFIMLVEADGSGNLSSTTHVLRAYDGVEVKEVKPFKDLYDRRLQIVGRQLLLSEKENDGMTLRLYDVALGTDTWKRTFPNGSLVLKTQDPWLTGTVDPSGKVTVIDLNTFKELMTAQMDKKHLFKATEIHLLGDDQHFYLMPNGPLNPQVFAAGSNLRPGYHMGFGLRSIAVNGAWYAFYRTTGKLHWRTELVPPQMVLVDEFRDLPIILAASFASKAAAAGGQAARGNDSSLTITTVDKQTGKLLYDRKDIDGNNTNLCSVAIDVRAGKVEFYGWNFKITHLLAQNDGVGDFNKGKGGTRPGPERSRPRGGRAVVQPAPVKN